MTTNEAPARQGPVDPERVAQASSRIPAAADIARLTSLLSLMADPVRLRILYALDVSEELCVGDLALALGANEDQVPFACCGRLDSCTPTSRAGSSSTDSQTTSPKPCANTASSSSPSSPAMRPTTATDTPRT